MLRFEKKFPKNTRPATRNYLDTMRRVASGAGRFGSMVGRTLANSSGPSSRQSMQKHGKHYPGIFPKGSRVVGHKKATGPLSKANLSRKRRDVGKEMLKAAAYGRKSKHPGELSYEQIEMLASVWEKRLGRRTKNQLLKAVGAPEGVAKEDTLFRGGKRRTVKDLEKALRGAKNVNPEDIPLAIVHVRAASPGFEAPQHRGGISQEEYMKMTEEMGKFYGKDVQKDIEKEAGMEELGTEGGGKSAQQPTRWAWNVSSLTGWGKRNSGANKTTPEAKRQTGSLSRPSTGNTMATREAKQENLSRSNTNNKASSPSLSQADLKE